MIGAMDRTPASGVDRTGTAFLAIAGTTLAAAALLVGPDVALATTDTTFDAPGLD